MPVLTRAFCAALAISAFSQAPAHAGVILTGGPSGSPKCGEFFDKWNVEGAPAGILAMGGFGREILAAQDCLTKNDVATACKHWKGLLPVIDRTGPPLDAQRGAVEKLISANRCG